MSSLRDKKNREAKMQASLEHEQSRKDNDLFGEQTSVPTTLSTVDPPEVISDAPSPAPQPLKKKRGGQRKMIKKDKAVSLRVNGQLWDDFQQINNYYGIPSTVALNQYITQYVREKKAEVPEIFADND